MDTQTMNSLTELATEYIGGSITQSEYIRRTLVIVLKWSKKGTLVNQTLPDGTRLYREDGQWFYERMNRSQISEDTARGLIIKAYTEI